MTATLLTRSALATAEALVESWCSDPAMWLTHGIPADEHIGRIIHDVALALSKNAVAASEVITDIQAERVARAFEPALWQRIDKDLQGETLKGAATFARSISLEHARAAINALRGQS